MPEEYHGRHARPAKEELVGAGRHDATRKTEEVPSGAARHGTSGTADEVPAGKGRHGAAAGKAVRRNGPSSRRRGKLATVAPYVVLVLGLVALAVPLARDLYARWDNSRTISSLSATADDTDDPDRLALLASAYAYNAQLAGVSYSEMKDSATAELVADAEAHEGDASTDGSAGTDGSTAGSPADVAVPDVGEEPAPLDYAQQLRYRGETAISWVDIPKIGLRLPVYHGTSDATLSAGAGHLETSSLPVGGLSTHTVITAHSGTMAQRMFDDIRRLGVGDVFTLNTLGTSYAYEVDSVETVLPDEMDAVAIVPGEDRCTLVTCTPYGVNDHRLLVHAHRTTAQPTARTAADVAQGLVSPWTLPLVVGLAIAVALIVWLLVRRRRRGSRG